MLSTILAIIIHDISCRYGNMRHYQHPLVTIGNRLPTWKVRFVFSLKLYIIFRSRFALVNSGCYFCLYEGKATYYTNIVSYIYFFFGVSEVAECMCLLFHFFKRQTMAQTFYFLTIRNLSGAFENACACTFSWWVCRRSVDWSVLMHSCWPLTRPLKRVVRSTHERPKKSNIK